MEAISGGLLFFVWLFLLFLAVLWFLLPFAVFGIKDRLKRMEEAQKDTQRELTKISGHLEEIAKHTKINALQAKIQAQQSATKKDAKATSKAGDEPRRE